MKMLQMHTQEASEDGFVLIDNSFPTLDSLACDSPKRNSPGNHKRNSPKRSSPKRGSLMKQGIDLFSASDEIPYVCSNFKSERICF